MILLFNCQRRLAIITVFCLLGVCPLAFCYAGTASKKTQQAHLDYQTERDIFIAARKAIKKNDPTSFQSLSKKIKDYPLYRYLEFETLRLDIIDRPNEKIINRITAFEKKYQDKSLSKQLIRLLQRRLADRKKWNAFLQISHSPYARALPCETLYAKFQTDLIKTFDKKSLTLWAMPKQHPKPCAEVFKHFERKDIPDVVTVWKRIVTGMEAGQTVLVASLLKYLNSRDRESIEQWIDGYSNPEKTLRSKLISTDGIVTRHIISNLIKRWALKEPEAALKFWYKIRPNYLFSPEKRYQINKSLGMITAYRRLPKANLWLNRFVVREDDLEVMEWRVRTALLEQDWPKILTEIKRLPVKEQLEDHWQYWVGRSHESMKHSQRARKTYQSLAKQTSYHGFLAADKMGSSYPIYESKAIPDQALVEELAKNPQLIRAREYHLANINWEGRREWSNAHASFSPEQKLAAGFLAWEWGLFDRAMYSANASSKAHALTLKFPTPFSKTIQSAAKQNSLNPAWIYGVMRRESAFMTDIRSSAGAVGLMQLMPSTAKYVGKLLGKTKRLPDLTNATTNIELGSYYLRKMLDTFENHIALASAAYNAGASRVKRWLPSKRSMPADVWIDTIPFTETRRYVRAVLANTAFFEWRLQKKSKSLSTKLTQVPIGKPAR